MPILQVRELPENIYRKLKETADAEHRSLAQQAIIVLARGLDIEIDPRRRRRKILAGLANHQLSIRKSELSDPVELLRADRER